MLLPKARKYQKRASFFFFSSSHAHFLTRNHTIISSSFPSPPTYLTFRFAENVCTATNYQNKTIYRMVYLVLLVYPNQPLIEGKDTIIKLNVLCNVLCVNYQMGWILVLLSMSYMVEFNYL